MLPDSVLFIKASAFENCNSLASVKLSANTSSIGERAFANCRALLDITIPDATTLIEKVAFTNCSAMVTAIVGNGVTTIGEDAFAGCSSLQSIDLGRGVELIGKRAFHECNTIVGIICRAETPPTVEYLKLPEEVTIYAPKKVVKLYKKAMGWSNYAKRIKRIKE